MPPTCRRLAGRAHLLHYPAATAAGVRRTLHSRPHRSATIAAAPRSATEADSTAQQQQRPQRVAVIGGGFAGLAVAWHLLAASQGSNRPMQLQLFDAVGLGAGGSGAAAGLLHPYTPRGKVGEEAGGKTDSRRQPRHAQVGRKAGTLLTILNVCAQPALNLCCLGPLLQLLWRGLEAFKAAVELLQAAEVAVASAGNAQAAEGVRQPFAWRHGMLRPARSAKQAADVARFLAADPTAAAATGAEAVTDPAALAALVPGLQPELLLGPEQQQPKEQAAPSGGVAQRKPRRQQQLQQQQPAAAPALGLMVHAATTIHPASYMQALWLACQQAAEAMGGSSTATLHQGRSVESLARLDAEEGPFDAIVVAAGAAVDSIAELAGRLPLDLCHGYSLDMRPPASGSTGSSDASGSSASCSGGAGSSRVASGSSGSSGQGYPPGAPSLLGSPYIAAHGSVSLVVGATKRYGLTPGDAFAQLSHPLVRDAGEAAEAAAALLPLAAQLWPPLAGWQVEAVRAGVRALPVRGSDGSIPYAGRLEGLQWRGGTVDASDSEPEPPVSAALTAAAAGGESAVPAVPSCWVVGGLGARGLVYHAWLGRLVAAAVLAGTDADLPPELLRWKQPSTQ